MNKLVAAVNAAWKRLYPPQVGAEPHDVHDEAALVKRVAMIADDVLCGRANFSAANKAYIEADAKLRRIASEREA